eukprot:748795-Hanusia_phi.AAC.1
MSSCFPGALHCKGNREKRKTLSETVETTETQHAESSPPYLRRLICFALCCETYLYLHDHTRVAAIFRLESNYNYNSFSQPSCSNVKSMCQCDSLGGSVRPPGLRKFRSSTALFAGAQAPPGARRRARRRPGPPGGEARTASLRSKCAGRRSRQHVPRMIRQGEDGEGVRRRGEKGSKGLEDLQRRSEEGPGKEGRG